MWLESGAPVALGEGCSLGVVAGVGVGGGHAASVKPQQGREEAMKTSPSLLCPSSPDVPHGLAQSEARGQGHWAGWRKVEHGSREAKESIQYPAPLGR